MEQDHESSAFTVYMHYVALRRDVHRTEDGTKVVIDLAGTKTDRSSAVMFLSPEDALHLAQQIAQHLGYETWWKAAIPEYADAQFS